MFFMSFFQQYPIVISFAAILLAEITKSAIDFFRRRASLRFLSPGGMPSGHSAFVSSLVVVVAYSEGISSIAFAISAVLALIVMYDAIYHRNESGKHAKMLNRLNKGPRLEESLGHTHAEVIGGAVFGAVVAFFLLTV